MAHQVGKGAVLGKGAGGWAEWALAEEKQSKDTPYIFKEQRIKET